MSQRDLARLPVSVETVDAARERFHKALSPVVDAVAIARNDPRAYYPSKHRQHVFDVAGIRAIISVDQAIEKRLLHVSLSFHKGGASIKDIRAASATLQRIGGVYFERQPDEQRITNGIIHWFWEMNDE